MSGTIFQWSSTKEWNEMLAELLASGKLNGWESGVFKEIYEREQATYGFNQKLMFAKAHARIHGLPDPTSEIEFTRSKLITIKEEVFISLDGKKPIGPAIVKKEAKSIQAWLEQALSSLQGKSSTRIPVVDEPEYDPPDPLW